MDNGTKATQSRQEETLLNHEGFLTELVQSFLQKVLNAEFENYIQAKPYERSPQRNGLRNGSYERQLHTRVGSFELHVCRDREGLFKTELFERYQRSEKALVLTFVDMYIHGVSTRKVGGLVETLCGKGVSKSQVSKCVTSLDNELKLWRERPLTRPYLYLVVDARYEKIRENGLVLSKAVVVVVGITEEGAREILGCWVINSESYHEWNDCFKSLKERGLTGVRCVVSDDNKGLRKALMQYFQGVTLQRCQVHFMRNFMGKLALKDRPEGVALLQELFAASTKEKALERMNGLVEFLLSKKKAEVAGWIEENIEETLNVYTLPEDHRKKMKSTNMLERLNQELKRRSVVVRIFPNEASCLRLLSALCQETSESWDRRKYLDMSAFSIVGATKEAR